MQFKNYIIKLLFSIFLLITVPVDINQNQPIHKNNLNERVDKNYKLFLNNPEKAFLESLELLDEAITNNDNLNELKILGRHCWYYVYKSDTYNLIISAQILEKKSIEYKNNYFQAMSYNYMLNAYTANNLYDKAIIEFNKSMAILEKEDEYDSDIIFEKGNAYTYLANLYNYRKEKDKALNCLLSAAKESEKLKDLEKKRKVQYQNYAHIASYYLTVNPDSVEYYVEKSIKLKPEGVLLNHHTEFLNYCSLGGVRYLHKEYEEALFYLKKAEEMIPSDDNIIINKETLFKSIYYAYQALSDTINSNKYELKLKEIRLEIEQNKNKSLHKIIQDFPKEDYSKIYLIGTISFIFIVVLSVFIYKLKRKNKLLKEQEKKSQEYLDSQVTLNDYRGELYNNLIDMIKQDNPDYMKEFLKIFPDFEDKLRLINPSIRQSDIEFCTFLKLNMPTKEIARWKNIAPKTVHNNKYRIRKRLNIPDNIDIYYWFSQF